MILKVKDDALIGATMLSVKGAYTDAADKSGNKHYNSIHSGVESRELIYIKE